MSLTYFIKIVPISTHEPNVNVIFITAELGLAAGVTSHPPQLFPIDTVGEVTDDTLELFKDLGFELHYIVHSLRPDTKIKTLPGSCCSLASGSRFGENQLVSELRQQEPQG